MSGLSIVMYHYVRELSRSRFPGIKGLELADFREQLSYLERHYQFVSVDTCLSALEAGPLPERALLLTFDDGYRDHYDSVLPLLVEKKIPAAFFPCARPFEEAMVMDVHKIHFVLAAVPSTAALIETIFERLDGFRREQEIESNDSLYRRLARPFGFDDAPTIFAKRVLQRELPEALRARLVDELFRLWVTEDERAFSKTLYFSLDEAREMVSHGMRFGAHGWDHLWWTSLDSTRLRREIDSGMRLVHSLHPKLPWISAYPYGAHDETIVAELTSRGCALALTSKPGIAQLEGIEAIDTLLLPRLDTNHLPRVATAAPNAWTLEA